MRPPLIYTPGEVWMIRALWFLIGFGTGWHFAT